MFTVTAFCSSLLHDSPIFVQIAGISQFHSFREAQVSKFKKQYHSNNPMITSVKENWTPLDHYVDTQDIDTEILKPYRTGFNAFLSLFFLLSSPN